MNRIYPVTLIKKKRRCELILYGKTFVIKQKLYEQILEQNVGMARNIRIGRDRHGGTFLHFDEKSVRVTPKIYRVLQDSRVFKYGNPKIRKNNLVVKKLGKSGQASRTRANLFAKQNGKCFYCDKVTVDFKDLQFNNHPDKATIEHLIPKNCNKTSLEGKHVMACRKCNELRGNHDLLYFLRKNFPNKTAQILKKIAELY